LSLLERPHWWTDPESSQAARSDIADGGRIIICGQRRHPACRSMRWRVFHLGNGARLERINWLADTSDKALAQAHGLMVNYRYELDDIEKNHELYAEGRTVVAPCGAAHAAPAARTGPDRGLGLFRSRLAVDRHDGAAGDAVVG